MRLPVRFIWIGVVITGLAIALVAVASAVIVWSATSGTAGTVRENRTTVTVAANNSVLNRPLAGKQTSFATTTAEPPVNHRGKPSGTASSSKPESIRDFVFPSSAPVLRRIGNFHDDVLECYRFHPGTDVKMAEGSVVRSVAAGTVLEAGADPLLAAKVVVDCGDGWMVVYGGLNNLRVYPGEKVIQNQALGQIVWCAEAGRGPALLHYEAWHNNEVQDTGTVPKI